MTRSTGAALLLLAFAGSAEAGCVNARWSARVNGNPTINTSQTIDRGGCLFSYTGGLNVTYESLTVVRRPRHMTVTPGSNGYSLRLQVLNGYTGKDACTIRLCGRNQLGSGCMTIIYDLTII
jgi:hypothetical protein